MTFTPDTIREQKGQWSTRVRELEQETESLNTRLQAIYIETQQLRGAIQACDVFLGKFDTNIQLAPQLAPKDE